MTLMSFIWIKSVLLSTCAFADVHQIVQQHLAPLTSATSSYLIPSARSSYYGEAIFTKSGLATSYAAPPSGPVPSGLYNSPKSYYSSNSYSNVPIAIIKFDIENAPDYGSYKFEYETENNIAHQATGIIKRIGTGQAIHSVHGSYSYVAPDGQTITVEYVADENGFRATGDHIPTPSPIPEGIQRSLAITGAVSAKPASHSFDSRDYLAPYFEKF